MLTAMVTGILCCVMHILVMSGKRKYALALIIFLIPMAERTVLMGPLRFSFVSLLILVCLLSTLLRKQHEGKGIEYMPYRRNIAAICMCLGLSLISFLATDIDSSIVVNDKSVVNSLTCYISSTIAGLGLYYLLTQEIKSYSKTRYYTAWYLLSIFFLAVVVFALNVTQIHLPSFLNPYVIVKEGGVTETITASMSSVEDRTYFAGYIGYTENFAEYLFTMFALGYLLVRSSANRLLKLIGSMACVIAIFFTLFCAIKSLLIMLVIFLVLVSSFLRKLSTSIQVLIFAAILGFVFYFFMDFARNTFLYQRYLQLVGRYISIGGLNTPDDFAILIGRRDLFVMFWDIIRVGGVLGSGPFVVLSIGGSGIAFHNLFYALILNYGIIGVCVYYYYFIKILYDMRGVTSASSQVNAMRAIFLSLFIVLLIEQIKLSAFRIPFGVISWWFLFALFASFINIGQRLNRIGVTK